MTTQAQPPPAQEIHGRGLVVIYVALMLAILLAALDQTIVSTALPTIVGDLGGLSRLSWVVTAYILAKRDRVPGQELALQAGVTMEHGRPYVDFLVQRGMVARENGLLHITDAGRAAADRLFAARHELLENLVADWSPEQHAEVAELLSQLSRALLGEDADRGVLASPVPGPAVASG